ncbi:toxin YhaV [Caenispirillum bisanense]|uniref:Toxin YhaV n=1 Tax=Caenispirillum bisanense TaxID=414052 RepID=A0A286G214_9PROT|nr:toxin YhaV [Caenispirillum bisanense]
MSLTVNGWTLRFHGMMIGQIRALAEAFQRARANDPSGYRRNANVRVLAAIAKLVLSTIPQDPGHANCRIGNTMGDEYRHWSRAKFGQRFRLFFRYDSRARIIIFAWVNDETTLRARGSKTDPYTVFKGMLDRGNPPDTWNDLMAAAGDLPSELQAALQNAGAADRE